ncbi:caspase-6-like [Crassostrea virginica]
MLNEDSVENGGDKETSTRKLQSSGQQNFFDTSDIYDFSHNKRGCAVLIMNHEFANPDLNLPPVQHDINSMSKLFSSLGFDVKLLINLTLEQLSLKLDEIRDGISNDCDCFVCVISTHGGEVPTFYQQTDIKGAYSKTEHYFLNTSGDVWTRDIMDTFDDQKCRALRGKPRLFFIQACRGNDVDEGVDLIDDGTKIEKDNNVDEYVNQDVFQIPCYNDSLVMFSSASGKYAWFDEKEGGWLLIALDRVLSSRSGEDLLSLLTEVCGDVATREVVNPSIQRAHRSKSTACVYHKLCKDIYFPSQNLK